MTYLRVSSFYDRTGSHDHLCWHCWQDTLTVEERKYVGVDTIKAANKELWICRKHMKQLRKVRKMVAELPDDDLVHINELHMTG